MNRNDRMNKLNNAGYDTKKYFNIPVPNGLKPGSVISVVIDENGNPTMKNIPNETNMDIRNQIIEDGYVRNTKLHRRFVMAQMFNLLNYSGRYSNIGKHGYTDALNVYYGFDYTMKMMLEEVRVLAHLQKVDDESFNERVHFFTIDVISHTVQHYRKMLEEKINNIKVRHCKGVPYKKIKGTNVFVSDFNKKIYYPIDKCISDLKYMNSTHENISYDKIYNLLYKLMKYHYISLDYNVRKSHYWIDAFKGEGAYYTLKNLIMYHDCFVIEDNQFCFGVQAMNILTRRLEEYKTQGWRMFAFMKKVIKDNDFDFNKRMNEIYSEE